MAHQSLRDWHILVVEDEYLLASDLEYCLSEAGAVIVGPVGTRESALNTIKSENHIDGAILDVNLRGVLAYDVADLLMQRHVPFIFTTGYDQGAIPSRFDHVPRCEKPYNMAKVQYAMSRAMEA